MSTGARSYGDPKTRARILTVSWELIGDHGSSLKLSEVAERAAVSRQAVYLHFGDRNGLLLALVNHMDETLELSESLAHVHAAPSGKELFRRAMQLNDNFWTAVCPVAQVLEAAQYHDQALGAAWRDRMRLRQAVFEMMIQQLVDMNELSDEWTIDAAAGVLYAVAHFDTWRELTHQLDWTSDQYVDSMARLLCRSLLAS